MGADYKPRRARMVTGVYEGDGNATQAIVGLGFQPIALIVYRQATVNNGVAIKITEDALVSGVWILQTPNWRYMDDMLRSLDPDGFTVGDGTGFANTFNINLEDYSFIAFG